MVWVALEHIAAGQEIYVSYLLLFDWQTITERRALL